jgi:hypothetical protein
MAAIRPNATEVALVPPLSADGRQRFGWSRRPEQSSG